MGQAPCHNVDAICLAVALVKNGGRAAQGGKLVKAIKSEEAPVPNDAPVTVLTANNFDEIVTLGKNVMIEFYAPWCVGLQNNTRACSAISSQQFALIAMTIRCTGLRALACFRRFHCKAVMRDGTAGCLKFPSA